MEAPDHPPVAAGASTGRLLGRVAGFTYDRPLAVAGALLVLFLAAGYGVSRLRVDFSLTSFYGGADAGIEEFRAFRERWGPDDDVLMIVVEAVDGDLLSPSAVAAIGRVADALRALPDVRRVDSLATARLVLPGATGNAPVPLPNLLPLDPDGPASRDEVLALAPFVPVLLSADGLFAAIAIQLDFSTNDLGPTLPAVDRIMEVVRAYDGRDGLRLAIAGLPAIRAGFLTLTIHDQMIFIPAALALIGVALFVVFRRLHGVIVPGLAAVLPMALLLGAMGYLREPIGLLNQAYFTLIPVLAVADAIHLLSRYHEELTRHGQREAVVRAVEQVGLACTLTTATTALALASLGLAGMPILRSFGVFAALGMLFAYGVIILSLPLLLRFTPPSPSPRSDGRWFVAVGGWAIRHPVAVLAGAVLLGGILTVAALRVDVDNRLLSGLLGPDHPIRQASERLDASLGGTLSLEVDLEGQDGAFIDPWIVGAVAGFETWAAELDGVRSVLGPGRSVLGVAARTRSTFDNPDDVRSVYERLGEDVDLSRFVDERYGRARVSVRVAEPGGRAFEAFAEEVLSEARAALEPEGLRATTTGTALVAYRGVNRISADIGVSMILVFAVVIAVFLALFRSPRIALLALLPNGLPLLAGVGTIGLLGMDFDPLAGVVLAFGLGIAVDDTIHVLVRVREQLAAGDALPAAIRHALAHSGRAVAITSVVVSGGLGINVFSSFPPLQMLGFLGALVMLTALACNLVLLPALLVLFRADAAMESPSAPDAASRSTSDTRPTRPRSPGRAP